MDILFNNIIVMCLYFGIEYLKNIFRIRSKKITLIIIICISFLTLYLSEIIFLNNIVKEKFMLDYFPYIAFSILFIIPIIILIFSKIKKAKL